MLGSLGPTAVALMTGSAASRAAALTRKHSMEPQQFYFLSTALTHKKTPTANAIGVLLFRSLAMTYSHMGKPHTTIGDAPFHC